MKRILKTWALVAAAAMGVVACQKELQEEVPVTGETVQVTFVAGAADTKTSVDTSDDETPLFSWDESETFAVLEQRNSSTPTKAGSVEYEKVDGKAKITATFGAGSYVKGATIYQYVTIYPASGYVGAESLAAATLSLPAEQTMATGSYDPAADLMVSTMLKTTAPPTEAQMVSFTRMAAVVKMTLKNFTLEAGDQVEQVIFTAEGKTLAGTITANLAKPNGFAAAEGVDNVTVNTTSSTDVYFTVLPTTLEAGDAYTVTVVTNKKLYIKQGTIPAEKSLVFEKGNVTRLGVNMEGVVPIDKWVLVRDASTLKEGDVVTFVAKDYDMAISKELYSNASETSTSARRAAVAISKYQDYLIANENVQPFILVPGSSVGTFSFYDEGRAKFLVSNNKTSRYLINQAYVDSNTSFAITIDAESGDATVMNIEGDYKDCMIRYYNSSKYFYSGTSANQAICIYKRGGVTGEIPTVPANVTVPASDKPVVIAEEGAAEATAISEVVFNYVGNWTITPSTNAEWLNVAYDATKNCLTYTAEANTGAKRDAVVTITASLKGQEDIIFDPFTVTQKALPTEITVADFKLKTKNLDAVYKLTGVITAISASSGNAYTLSDGNGTSVDITYLYTDTNEMVYNNQSIGLAIGDVVTVTTVVAGSTDGKGGSSAYHSIYKGHYRVTAEAEPEIVGYEGGAATITVAIEQNGTLGTYCLPTAIEGTMPQSDFANLAYTTGEENAIVTFDENNGSSRSIDVTFRSGLADVTVNIGQKNHPSVKVGWFLVTDVNELNVNDKVIIAAKSPDGTLDYAISSKASTSAFRPSVAISVQGNSIPNVDGVQLYTLENGHADCPGTWAFKGDSDSKYLYYSSGLKVTGTLNANGSWALTVSLDGKATLVSQTTNSKNTMGLNWTTSNQTFSMYTSTDALNKGAIYIYKYYN